MPDARRRRFGRRLIGLGLLAVLVVAMVLNTKFLSPAQLAAALPKEFDAKDTAAQLFAKARADLPGQAKPASAVIPAIQAGPKSAAAKLKAVSPADNSYVFPVTATGTVTDASAMFLRLKVPGVPSQTTVLVPLAQAINGTVVRDAMGFKFADAPGQTDYQYVGDEVKKLIQSQVVAPLSPAKLKGKKVTVVGAISVLDTGSPPPAAKPVNIQPVSIKETP